MDNFHIVAAALVAAVATARLTRLVVWDSWPPVVWLRIQWDELTGMRDEFNELVRDSKGDVVGHWTPMLHCGYCFAAYPAAVVLLSGWASGWHTAWWIVCGWLALTYVGAIVMAYDGED